MSTLHDTPDGPKPLSGRTALITGAPRSIGRRSPRPSRATARTSSLTTAAARRKPPSWRSSWRAGAARC